LRLELQKGCESQTFRSNHIRLWTKAVPQRWPGRRSRPSVSERCHAINSQKPSLRPRPSGISVCPRHDPAVRVPGETSFLPIVFFSNPRQPRPGSPGPRQLDACLKNISPNGPTTEHSNHKPVIDKRAPADKTRAMRAGLPSFRKPTIPSSSKYTPYAIETCAESEGRLLARPARRDPSVRPRPSSVQQKFLEPLRRTGRTDGRPAPFLDRTNTAASLPAGLSPSMPAHGFQTGNPSISPKKTFWPWRSDQRPCPVPCTFLLTSYLTVPIIAPGKALRGKRRPDSAPPPPLRRPRARFGIQDVCRASAEL